MAIELDVEDYFNRELYEIISLARREISNRERWMYEHFSTRTTNILMDAELHTPEKIEGYFNVRGSRLSGLGKVGMAEIKKFLEGQTTGGDDGNPRF